MSDVMTMEEIKARYAPDWVLIAEPEIGESLEVLSGRVAFHSPDQDAVYKKATELRLDRCAFRFLGEHHCETIGLFIEIPSPGTSDAVCKSVPEEQGMSEVLTYDEIKTRYAPDWVLIVEPQTDEFQHLYAGRVAFHSPDRDAVYDRAIELQPPRCAVRWTGEYPEGMEFLL